MKKMYKRANRSRMSCLSDYHVKPITTTFVTKVSGATWNILNEGFRMISTFHNIYPFKDF